MNRNEIVRQLHLIIDARLFGTAAWPVDRESASRLQATLLRMGLVEEVPGRSDTWRNTSLGNELRIDLLEVFMGCWDECEIPMILEQYGLIEEQEVHRLWRVLKAGAGWERTFKDCVRQAGWPCSSGIVASTVVLPTRFFSARAIVRCVWSRRFTRMSPALE